MCEEERGWGDKGCLRSRCKKGERTEKSKDVAWMSKPTEGPGVMRGVCFPSATIAAADALDQSPNGEQVRRG